MTHNDLLRRLRYALDLSDSELLRLLDLGGRPTDAATLSTWMARDEDPAFAPLPDAALSAFLDGLVTDRRGPRDPAAPARPAEEQLDNNGILKKLRIALELQEGAMLEVLRLGGMTLSPSELGALFRRPGHKHYREAGDQLLRNFVKGLTSKLRGRADAAAR